MDLERSETCRGNKYNWRIYWGCCAPSWFHLQDYQHNICLPFLSYRRYKYRFSLVDSVWREVYNLSCEELLWYFRFSDNKSWGLRSSLLLHFSTFGSLWRVFHYFAQRCFSFHASSRTFDVEAEAWKLSDTRSVWKLSGTRSAYINIVSDLFNVWFV